MVSNYGPFFPHLFCFLHRCITGSIGRLKAGRQRYKNSTPNHRNDRMYDLLDTKNSSHIYESWGYMMFFLHHMLYYIFLLNIGININIDTDMIRFDESTVATMVYRFTTANGKLSIFIPKIPCDLDPEKISRKNDAAENPKIQRRNRYKNQPLLFRKHHQQACLQFQCVQSWSQHRLQLRLSLFQGSTQVLQRLLKTDCHVTVLCDRWSTGFLQQFHVERSKIKGTQVGKLWKHCFSCKCCLILLNWSPSENLNFRR